MDFNVWLKNKRLNENEAVKKAAQKAVVRAKVVAKQLTDEEKARIVQKREKRERWLASLPEWKRALATLK